MLGFAAVEPVVSVHAFLAKLGCEDMLREPGMAYATMTIIPDGKSRAQIQQEIKRKETNIRTIATKWARLATPPESRDRFEQLIYSIGDNFAFLNDNRRPIDRMIVLLERHFDPEKPEPGMSLAIAADDATGARLTHSHARHYSYVRQSLTLWREITDDMFRLWTLAERDLLAEDNPYELRDTGQGHQRVQAAPRVLSAMRTILHQCQQSLGSWIGSSVIHLGDSNVPNAMMFVDKYTQISRILAPILQTLKEVDVMEKEPGIKRFILQGWGSSAKLKHAILYDFFKNAFDGSGADNFFDAGSCIDGRLTSAWNWCSSLPDKPFYPVFLLSGFVGFDGEFQE